MCTLAPPSPGDKEFLGLSGSQIHGLSWRFSKDVGLDWSACLWQSLCFPACVPACYTLAAIDSSIGGKRGKEILALVTLLGRYRRPQVCAMLSVPSTLPSASACPESTRNWPTRKRYHCVRSECFDIFSLRFPCSFPNRCDRMMIGEPSATEKSPPARYVLHQKLCNFSRCC